jgi:putative FmdB family regulatory protein
MPIYAYRCDDCGHAQDFLQKMSDPLIDTCPQCGSKNFKKQLTAAGFQLKGGGWYVTDFRDNGKKDGKKPDAAGTTVPAPSTTSSAEGSGGGDAKSGAKPDGGTATPASGGSSCGGGSGSSGAGRPATPSGGTKAA